MGTLRKLAFLLLVGVFLASLGADLLAPAGYAHQFREELSAAPSTKHWLGTDELGRDRLARLLHGTRVSLLLAPAAALLATGLAALIGGLAGYIGGWPQRLAVSAIDLFLSLPWLFLLILMRAMLPLNTSPATSVAVTFALLGLLGWAAAARIVCTGAANLRDSGFVLLAHASGVSPWRTAIRHVLPNLAPVLKAQFWISIPLFILAEANLGILGLGVAEPLPSWGSMLRDLEGLISFGGDLWRLAPLVLMVLVVASFQVLVSREEGSV